MTADEALRLEAMMRAEHPDYLKDFRAFVETGALSRQCAESQRDVFAVIYIEDELAGFFCLRGLDAGYERPSFGLYVASRFARRGVGRFSLQEALRHCREKNIPRLMLKVAPTNEPARKLYEEAGFVPCGRCADTGHEMMDRLVENG